MSESKLPRVIAASFAAVACLITLLAFAAMARHVRDAVVLSAYVTNLFPGQEYRFGYGGERREDQVNVPFQGREMSNVAFTIGRPTDAEITIVGRDDRIRVNRQWFEPAQQATLTNKDRIESQGWLGRAGFQVLIDKNTNTLRLQLDTPLHEELEDGLTRLVLAEKHEPVPTNVDEIFFRTPPGTIPGGESFRLTDHNGVVRIDPELSSAVGATQSNIDSSIPKQLKHNETWIRNDLELTFRHYQSVFAFGLKWIVALVLLGFILVVGPQVHWPNESLVFSSAAILVSVGVALSAHSYLFGSHNQYFPRYIEVFYYSSVVLFWLRFPFGPEITLKDVGGIASLALAGLGVGLVYLLIVNPFEPYEGLWAGIKLLFFAILVFGVLGLLGLFITELIQWGLRRVSNFPWTFSRMSSIAFLATLPLLLVGITVLFGGREAVPVASGFRIHLPTLMLPLIVGITTILLTAAREQKDDRVIILLFGILIVASLTVYRLVSQDNGGTALLVVGVLVAVWLSWRRWLLPTVISAVLLLATAVAAYFNKPERFDISLGNANALAFYDQARNLRLARDMARAGGLFGLGQKLTIPAGLKSNLHNDLVVAYIAGYFGWLVLALVVVAYIVLYDRLWSGLFGVLQSYRDDERDKPNERVLMRQLLVTFALSLVAVSIFQTLWMLTSPLQSLLPMTGLDLQPISASRISMFTFVVVLLGSAAIAQTNHRSLEK